MGRAVRRQRAGAACAGIPAAAISTRAAPIGGRFFTRSIRRRDSDAAEVARIEKAQPALLQADRPPRAAAGVTDIYALGIAGWADQDVFVKELDGGLDAIASVLPIKDHTIRLINSRDTLETVPLADLQNFKAAVHAIGKSWTRTKTSSSC